MTTPGPAGSPQNTTSSLGSAIGNHQDIHDGEKDAPIADNEQNSKKAPKSPTDVSDHALLHGFAFYITMSCAIMAAFLIAFTATILGTATPSITSEFNTVEDVGWYAAAYLIANCGMTPFTGRLYRMFHIKHLFMGFIGVFEIGCIVSGTAKSSKVLIVGRAISGIGGAGIVTGTTTIIASTVPLNRRALMMGIGMGVLAVGQVVGPLIGGALTTISWRWCFYINLPIGGAVLVALALFVKLPVARLTKSDKTVLQRILSIDLVGFAIFSAACVMFLLGLEWGGDAHPWNSPTVLGLLCGGGVTFLCLAAWFSYKGDAALIPPRLSKDRINLAIAITGVLQGGGVFLSSYWLPIWFQGVKGASPIASGVMILPMVISQFVASVACGAIVQKTGYYLPEVVGGNALVTVGAALLSTMTPGTSEGQWIGYQILIGVGRAFVMQLLVTAIQTNLPPEDASLGSSYVSFAQYFGGAVFAAAAKTAFTEAVVPALQEYAPGVSPSALKGAGVTDVRHDIPADLVRGVILAYNKAITHVFYVQLATAAAALVAGCFVGWRKVNAKKGRLPPPAKKPADDVEARGGVVADDNTNEVPEDLAKKGEKP
ncbi:uncharacterized protein E0L32_003780 [Thyridium curvatum]|uniref:Major facilitator superfamily (MFS) profile domain-containing protein n=1 Tax=Thyridium curvatum TaxID=1093900 RepID=A0A507BB76_9PEZI|nr:uncharacterized protein E0L32_003780 [Thyridium curvatum]TPX16486.1 hypothetical protein E0L32_003780 [Thyridium curvatum]